MSLRVNNWLFTPGQFVTRTGDLAYELYYIKYGEVRPPFTLHHHCFIAQLFQKYITLHQFPRNKSVTSWRGQKSVVSVVSCRFPNFITTTSWQLPRLRRGTTSLHTVMDFGHPLHKFPRNFSVDGEAPDLLRIYWPAVFWRADKSATSRCNEIWETTRHNRHNGLLPAPTCYGFVTDLFMLRTCYEETVCNGFWPL